MQMPKRKYFRKCGICGERHEQNDMIRCEDSPNGWICKECYEKKSFEGFWEEETW